MDKTISIEDIVVPIGTHEEKRVALAADHRGFSLKQFLLNHLNGWELEDLGTHSSEACDAPTLSYKLGKFIYEDSLNRVGIGICGTGTGMLLVANKFPGVMGSRCVTEDEAIHSRKNNTNLIGIGADGTDYNQALSIVQMWLTTPFYSNPEADQRYMNRYVQIRQLEIQMQKNLGTLSKEN